MDSTWDKLFLVLDDILKLYGEMLEISKGKKAVLVAANTVELEKMTKQEELLILQIGKLDEARQRILSVLFQQLGVNGQNLSLSELKELATPETALKLEKFQQQLNQMQKELVPLNKLNTELIRQALGFVNYNINILSQSAVGPTYAVKGHTEQAPQSRLVIDAKI